MTITSIDPLAGSVAGGLTVTVNGANFLTNTACYFGTVAATASSYTSATRLRCVAPALPAAGPVALEVTRNNVDFSSTGVLYTATSAWFFCRCAVLCLTSLSIFLCVCTDFTVVGIAPSVGSTSGGTSVSCWHVILAPGQLYCAFGTKWRPLRSQAPPLCAVRHRQRPRARLHSTCR